MASDDVDAATVAIDNCEHTGPLGFDARWELAVAPTIEIPCFTWRVRLTCATCGAIFAPDPLRGVCFDHQTQQWLLHAQALPPSALAAAPVPIH